MKNIMLVVVLFFCLIVDGVILYMYTKDARPSDTPLPHVVIPPGGSTIIPPDATPPNNPVPPAPIVRMPEFIEVPLVNNRIKEDSLYADIINHSRNPVLDHNRATNAHETTHMINNDIRNAATRQLGKKMNGFYVRQGKGVVVEEPKCKKNDIKEFLPQSLQSYRYKTYIAGQQAWNDQPLYIMDEAIAYWNDAMTNCEDVQKGRYKGGMVDGVSGCVDFSIYSIALAMAIEKRDPGYWQSNTQYRNFLIWYLKGAEETYKIGAQMKEFNGFAEQKRLLSTLRTGANAASMRDFITKNLEGVWLKE
jgi:hypothetical protein